MNKIKTEQSIKRFDDVEDIILYYISYVMKKRVSCQKDHPR